MVKGPDTYLYDFIKLGQLSLCGSCKAFNTTDGLYSVYNLYDSAEINRTRKNKISEERDVNLKIKIKPGLIWIIDR